MSSVRTCVSTEGRIRDGARWTRIKRSAGLSLLSAAVVGSIIPFAAESAGDLKLPASFRNWYHVNTMVIDKGSPLFDAMGGMHNVYINSTGETALKKGEPYPDKTVLLVDLHEFTVSDGSYVEGPRKATAIMLKDKKKYASTGGWGFQAWVGGDPTKPLVTDPTKQCFECHRRRRTKITCIQPTSRDPHKREGDR
jgi:cytochrome P460